MMEKMEKQCEGEYGGSKMDSTVMALPEQNASNLLLVKILRDHGTDDVSVCRCFSTNDKSDVKR